MQSLALVVHVLLAVSLIVLVLLQHGKGADAGAAFGSGASATVFGARGATSFLTRMTTLGAVLFFGTSLLLFWIAAHRDSGVRSVTDVPGLVEEAPPPPAPLGADGDLPGAIAPDAAPDAAPAAGGALPAEVPDVEPDSGVGEPAAGAAAPSSEAPGVADEGAVAPTDDTPR